MKGYDSSIALKVGAAAREACSRNRTRTGIEHESPRVIVLRNGKAVWHTPHG